MGVIIDGQERKSVAEQVEENSKYKGRIVKTSFSKLLRIYKKDIPCFIRAILVDIRDGYDEDYPNFYILKGNGSLLDSFTPSNKNTIVDYIIMESETSGAVVYKVNGNSLTYNWSPYGTGDDKDLVLSSNLGYRNYFMVIPLKYELGIDTVAGG